MKKNRFTFQSLFQSNRFLQVVAVAVGLLCWFFVAAYVNPDQEAEFMVTVDVADRKDVLDQLGLEIIGESKETVRVSVKGKRFRLSQIEAGDLVVRPNMSRIDGPGVYKLALNGENEDLEFLSLTPSTISVRLDVFSTKVLPIEVELTGFSVPEGYIGQTQTISPKSVSITGPEEQLSRITRCVFRYNLDNPVKRTTIVKGGIVLLDQNGNEVTDDHITTDIQTASLTMPVSRIRELPFVLRFINLPPGLEESDLTYTLSSAKLEVAVPTDDTDRYTEIPLGYVDMKELEPDSVFVFDVADALPANYENVRNIENVVVEFNMEDVEEKYINIDNFQILNQSGDYEITVTTNRLSNVKVYGQKDVLEELTPGDFVAEIDMSSREILPGQFSTGVNIYAPNKPMVWVSGDYSVIIHVVEKEQNR